MSYFSPDRRALLKLGGGIGASALLTAHFPTLAAAAQSNRSSEQFAALDESLGATIEAITARIIPTTETPGAREAGAVWFIDAALAGDMAPAMPLITAGAAQLDEAAAGSFAKLPDEEQDRLLQDFEDSDFFGFVHMLTLAGTFTMPRYGGNRNEVGWDLLGFERQHYWTPPFGYYDRDAHGTTRKDASLIHPAPHAHSQGKPS